MITGYNTDIPFNGKVYHVQTEDRGLKNPVVESLVYCKGEILTSRKSSYADLIESGRYAENVLQRRMETQHNDLMREVRNGGFEGEETMPFGHSIITNRSFDEVVLAFLLEQVAADAV